ncbi:MAG: type II secretion system protein [Opitutales bacterium]
MEIMIVVVIVGLLAVMAMPAFRKATENTRQTRFANDARIFAGQIEVFSMENGRFPEDASSGVMPEGLQGYIAQAHWDNGPAIGGVWDVETNDNGVQCAVGAHRYTMNEEQLLDFDQDFDDGDLSTGKYRKLAGDRYYLIIEE